MSASARKENNVPYLIDGQEVEVVEKCSSGFVIRRIYDWRDQVESDPEIVEQVFDEPPTERKAQVIKNMEAREAELRESIDNLAQRARERAALESQLAKLSGYGDAMARILDVVERRVTHYVVKPALGAPYIAEADKGALPYIDDYKLREGTKLLCLFGKSGGNLNWQVNQYYDGSGIWTEVEPFLSHHAAELRLQELVNAWESGKEYAWDGLIQTAEKHGLTVPGALRDHVAAKKLRIAQERVVSIQSELAKAEAAVGALIPASIVCIDCMNGQHEVSGHPDCTCACHGNGAAL